MAETPMTETRPDVVVVGGGPVGLTCALALAQRGVAVTVLEAGEQLRQEPRAASFHAPTLEVLNRLGVAEELVSVGNVIDTIEYRDEAGDNRARFSFSVLTGLTKFPFRLQAEQRLLTPILLDRLHALPNAEVMFNARVSSVDGGTDGATVHTIDRGSIGGRFVVGADGAYSAVRDSLGIAFDGETYGRRFLMVRTRFDVSAAIPDVAPVTYVLDQTRSVTYLRLRDHWRIVFRVAENVSDEEILAPAALQERIAGVLGRQHAPYDIIGAGLYTVHRKVAATFRQGSVMLAGDAAHLNNPTGGMGMNSGVLDAYDLAGRLSDVLSGRAPTAELDDYARRRRELAIEHVNAQTDQNYRIAVADDPAVRREHLRRLADKAADPVEAVNYLRKISMFDVAGDLLGERQRVQPAPR